MVQGYLKEIQRKFQERIKCLSGCSKKVFRVFQGSLKSVSRKFQGCFNGVGFQECVKEKSNECFRKSFKVSKTF